MDDPDVPEPVRFRAIIEMSFPDADPWDPADYGDLIERWRRSLENSTLFNCKEVSIRQISTIGRIDDYEDWRFGRGRYDATGRATIKGVTYPVPSVSPLDLARFCDQHTCQPGADSEALAARALFLQVLREKYRLPDWQDDKEIATRVYELAAILTIERPPNEIDAALFMRSLKAPKQE